ncbi:hypothetical protein GRF29_96g1497632 [Pseudopithomyces chartarum]|uniref:Uncharacterized protein n=1 Tax=Pseudopithomyces chartarum TaxID=1892770 RepID=A0AAN6LUY8_9PLEO|nr:hypothetical protein GRF29_96g1497632 [Pseudopithomyces chartarum]
MFFLLVLAISYILSLWYGGDTTPHPSVTQREAQAQAIDNEAVHRHWAADVEAGAADLQRRLIAAQQENQTRQASQRRLMIEVTELKTRLARREADMAILQQRLDRATERLTYIEKMITQRDETIANLRADATHMQGEIRTANDQVRTANEQVRAANERIRTTHDQRRTAAERIRRLEAEWRRTEQKMRNENQELTNQGQTLYTETQTLKATIQNLMTEGQQLLVSHQQLQQLSNQQAQGECAYVAVGFAATLQAAGVDVRMLRINEQRLDFLKDLIKRAMERQS